MHLREPQIKAVEARAGGSFVEAAVGPLQVARHALQLGDERAVVRRGVFCRRQGGDAGREQEEGAGHGPRDDDEGDGGGDAGLA